MKQLTLFALLAFILVSTAFQIKNINHQISLTNSQQYLQYIKALKGLSTEEDFLSNPVLSNIVQNERISLLNSFDDISLILVDQVKDNSQSLPSEEDIKKIQEIENQFQGFNMINLVNYDDEIVNKKIKEMQEAGKIVHILQVSQELAKQYQNHVDRKLLQTGSKERKESLAEKSQRKVNAPRTQTQVGEPPAKSSSYILKFFFSLLFIIISLGSLAAIANMQNKKDTLLYAKFIADVGAR